MDSQYAPATGRKVSKGLLPLPSLHSVAAHADKLIGERYTGVQKRAKPPPSSKKPQARAVRSTSKVDAQPPKRSTRSSKKDPQAQALGSQSTLAAQSIPLEPVQQSPATAPVGLRRRREVEEEYPSKRRKSPQATVDCTQPFEPLSEKNLEELDRQTGSEPYTGMDRAATGSGRGGKKRTISLRVSTADMDQDTASISTQKSSTLAEYRWKNLDYARIFVENAPLPQNILTRVNTIIQPEITDARKNELSLISEAFCDDFIDVMLGALREDDSVEPIHHALKSMDKGKKLMLSRKAGNSVPYTCEYCPTHVVLDWDPILKPNLKQKTWQFDTIKQPNGNAEDSPNHLNKRQQAEQAYVSPNSLEPTIPPPAPPPKQDISIVRSPRPNITIGPRVTNLVEKLKTRGFGEIEAVDFLKRLEYQQALRLSPLQHTVPMCLPLLVVEGKSYSTGRTVFEAQNQAAVSGAYMTDLQHNIAKFTESACYGTYQSKEPLAFSICSEGPMVQLWVHYTTLVDNVRMYMMNIIKACHASQFPSLRDGVRDFFEAVDGVMSWATSELLDEVAEQLVLVWKAAAK